MQSSNNLSVRWKYAWADQNFRFLLIVAFALALLNVYLTTWWLTYNETRAGYIFQDPVLMILPPTNFNSIIFLFTHMGVIIGLITSMITPLNTIKTFLAISMIAILRIVAMYFIPLEAPENMIVLRDPFLESTFYDNQVITKDLFFSGHTANLILLALLTEFRMVRNSLFVVSTAVGTMLLFQHVHFSIDVLFAPFFAYLSYRIAKEATAYIKKNLLVSERLNRV